MSENRICFVYEAGDERSTETNCGRRIDREPVAFMFEWDKPGHEVTCPACLATRPPPEEQLREGDVVRDPGLLKVGMRVRHANHPAFGRTEFTLGERHAGDGPWSGKAWLVVENGALVTDECVTAGYVTLLALPPSSGEPQPKPGAIIERSRPKNCTCELWVADRHTYECGTFGAREPTTPPPAPPRITIKATGGGSGTVTWGALEKPAPAPKPLHDFSDPYCAFVAKVSGAKTVMPGCKHCGVASVNATTAPCEPREWRKFADTVVRAVTDSEPPAAAPPPPPRYSPPEPSRSGLGGMVGVYRYQLPRR